LPRMSTNFMLCEQDGWLDCSCPLTQEEKQQISGPAYIVAKFQNQEIETLIMHVNFTLTFYLPTSRMINLLLSRQRHS
jgi:hypothetical protein